MLDGKKLLKVAILVALMGQLTACAPKIVLHPLTGKDIYDGKDKGDVCFSAYYLDQVMQTKIEKSN